MAVQSKHHFDLFISEHMVEVIMNKELYLSKDDAFLCYIQYIHCSNCIWLLLWTMNTWIHNLIVRVTKKEKKLISLPWRIRYQFKNSLVLRVVTLDNSAWMIFTSSLKTIRAADHLPLLHAVAKVEDIIPSM